MSHKKPFTLDDENSFYDADGQWVPHFQVLALLNNSPLGEDEKPVDHSNDCRMVDYGDAPVSEWWCEQHDCWETECIAAGRSATKPAAPNEREEAAKFFELPLMKSRQVALSITDATEEHYHRLAANALRGVAVDEGAVDRAIAAYDAALKTDAFGHPLNINVAIRAALNAALGEPK